MHPMPFARFVPRKLARTTLAAFALATSLVAASTSQLAFAAPGQQGGGSSSQVAMETLVIQHEGFPAPAVPNAAASTVRLQPRFPSLPDSTNALPASDPEWKYVPIRRY
jgi:hypothetical protein